MLAALVRRFGYKPPQVRFTDWKLVKGDTVIILSGRDKTKTGVIDQVHRHTNQVTVKGVNIVFFP